VHVDNGESKHFSASLMLKSIDLSHFLSLIRGKLTSHYNSVCQLLKVTNFYSKN
jgi:hypothetical protein